MNTYGTPSKTVDLWGTLNRTVGNNCSTDNRTTPHRRILCEWKKHRTASHWFYNSGESPTYILRKDETWNTRGRYFVLNWVLLRSNNHIVGLVHKTTDNTNASDVPRSLQSWVSTFLTVVLTADVFQLFIYIQRAKTSAVSNTVLMVEAQLCKLLGTHRDVVRIVLIKKKKKKRTTVCFRTVKSLGHNNVLWHIIRSRTRTHCCLLLVLCVVDIEAVYILSVDVQHTSSPCGFFMVERYKLYCHKPSTQR